VARRCAGTHQPTGHPAEVVILAGRGGPALHHEDADHGGVPHVVVILAGRGGPALPRRPARSCAGGRAVVILAGRGGPALHVFEVFAEHLVSWL